MIDTLSLPVSREGRAQTTQTTEATETFMITGTTGALQDPEANLIYFVKQDGNLALTWKVETRLEDEWLVSYVDAEAEPSVLGVIDYVSFATYEV